MTAQQMYETNQDFKRYVDGYSKRHNEGKSIPVSEALTHKIVEEVSEHYQTGGDSYWDTLNTSSKKN